jgi:hypothetical protein
MSLSEHLNKIPYSHDNNLNDYLSFYDKRKRNIVLCSEPKIKRKYNSFINNKIRSTK